MSITLVTGASRGVGEALAWKLAAEGHTVAALARTGDALQELSEKAGAEELPGTIIPCPVDLRDAEATRACVNSLEETAPIAQRVFGAAHPATTAHEEARRDARAALRTRETPSGSA